MNARFVFLASLAVSVFAGRVSAAEVVPIPVTGKVEWVLNYAEGQELARETGKPLFVVFRCER